MLIFIILIIIALIAGYGHEKYIKEKNMLRDMNSPLNKKTDTPNTNEY